MEPQVILVNEKDEPVGVMEKTAAHQKGILHRAFSIFIFNSRGEMLLQQRATGKYHSGGLWSNACCSHPTPGEKTGDAALRRLKEEMGFETPLEKIFDFVYKAPVGHDLVEYEFDHVFAGEYDGFVVFNTEEVMNTSFMSMVEIAEGVANNPGIYSAWFKIAFPSVLKWWQKKYLATSPGEL